jgi:hypothetical protein
MGTVAKPMDGLPALQVEPLVSDGIGAAISSVRGFLAIRCAWCCGWMSAPTWPAHLQVSHGLCPGCRDHLADLTAAT